MSVAGNYFHRPLFRYRGADVLNLLNLCSVNRATKKKLMGSAEIGVSLAAFSPGHAAISLTVSGRSGHVLLVLDCVPASMRTARDGVDRAASFLQSLSRSGTASAPPHPGMLLAGSRQCGVVSSQFFWSAALSSDGTDLLYLLVVDEVGDTDVWTYGEAGFTWTLFSSFSLNYAERPLSSYRVGSVALFQSPAALALVWSVTGTVLVNQALVLSCRMSRTGGGEIQCSPPAEIFRISGAARPWLHASPRGCWVAGGSTVAHYEVGTRTVTAAETGGGCILAAAGTMNAHLKNEHTLYIVTEGGALSACEALTGPVVISTLVGSDATGKAAPKACTYSKDDIGMIVWDQYMLLWRNRKRVVVRLDKVLEAHRALCVFSDWSMDGATAEPRAELQEIFAPCDGVAVPPQNDTSLTPISRLSVCPRLDGMGADLYVWSQNHVVDTGDCCDFFAELTSGVSSGRGGDSSSVLCIPSMAMLRKMSLSRLSQAHTAKLEHFWETHNHPAAPAGGAVDGKGRVKVTPPSSGVQRVHSSTSVTDCSCLVSLAERLSRRRKGCLANSTMQWLIQANAEGEGVDIIAPPLAFPSVGLTDLMHDNDVIQIATEEAYQYASLKNRIIETSTWRSSSRYDDTMIAMEVKHHLESVISFFYGQYPAFLFDVVCRLETIRGGWRGDRLAERTAPLLTYSAGRYQYFGESDLDEEEDMDDEEEEENEPGVSRKALLGLKAPYVERVMAALNVPEDGQTLSLEQQSSIIKLLCWGGKFDVAAHYLICWELEDDVITLNAALHRYCHNHECDHQEGDAMEKIRAAHFVVYSAAFQYFLGNSDLKRLRSLAADEPHASESLDKIDFDVCRRSRVGALSSVKQPELFML